MKTASSLSRVWKHVEDGNYGFAIITSWRQSSGENGETVPREENEANFKELKQSVKAGGYAHIELIGVWQEEGQAEAEKEPSLLIPNKKIGGAEAPIEELKKLMTRLAKKYAQEGYVLGDGEKVHLVDSSGAIFESFNSFTPSKAGEAYSTLQKKQRGGSFHFAGIKTPASCVGAMMKVASKSIWLLEAYEHFMETGSTTLPGVQEDVEFGDSRASVAKVVAVELAQRRLRSNKGGR